MQWIAALCLRLLVGKKSKENTISATEVIRGVINFTHSQGSVIKQDRDMLDSILDLDQVGVEQIMLHHSQIFSLNINLPVKDFIEHAVNSAHTRIPVWEENEDNIIGILHLRKLLNLLHQNKNITIEEIKKILSTPWFIPNTTSLKHQLQEFRKQRNHFALVIDEYGVLMGLVTLEDILEEIVGEIDDEHDTEAEEIIKITDNLYIVDATVNIRDINRRLDVKIDEDEVHTIGGLIIHHMAKLPNEGEEIIIDDIKYKILKIDGKKINKIELELLKPCLPASEE
jgi:Mg2+/Co2+ transporter CorB